MVRHRSKSSPRVFIGLVLACGCGSEPLSKPAPDMKAPPVVVPVSSAGDASAAGAAMPACSDGSYLPLKEGNRWTYRVTSPVDLPSMKTQTVVRMEPVPVAGPHLGKAALRVETRKSGNDLTVSWMVVEAGRSLRLAEESYVANTTRVNVRESWQPPRLRLDERPERVAAGATWAEMYSEATSQGGSTTTTTHVESWTVDAVADPCLVPGQGMRTCLRVRKSGSSQDAGKTYWFARCVGKVKEAGRPGMGQTEELVEFVVN